MGNLPLFSCKIAVSKLFFKAGRLEVLNKIEFLGSNKQTRCWECSKIAIMNTWVLKAFKGEGVELLVQTDNLLS